MKKIIVMSVLAALMPVCASAAGAKRYLVAFKDGTTAAQRDAALKSLGATKADDLSEIGALVAELPEGVPSMGMARRCKSSGGLGCMNPERNRKARP